MAMLGQATAAVQVVEEGAARVDAEEAAEVAENDLKSSFSLFIHLPICRENGYAQQDSKYYSWVIHLASRTTTNRLFVHQRATFCITIPKGLFPTAFKLLRISH